MEDLVALSKKEVGLLRQNYRRLKSEECKNWVVRFIRDTPDVSVYGIIPIKLLTKVADNILIEDPDSLEGLLGTLFQFNMQGLQKIRAGVGGYTPEHLYTLEAHLNRYAGDTAHAIFDTINGREDVSWEEKSLWLDRWYKSCKVSADMTVETEPIYSAYAYSSAGNAALAIFNLIDEREVVSPGEKILWLKRCYKFNKLSADMTVKINPKHSAHAYSFAGNAAMILFNKTKKLSWGERWYEAYKSSADMTVETEPKHSAHAYGFAGEAAKALFEKLGRKLWKRRSVACYNKFLAYLELNPDPEMSNTMGVTKLCLRVLGEPHTASTLSPA